MIIVIATCFALFGALITVGGLDAKTWWRMLTAVIVGSTSIATSLWILIRGGIL